MPVFLNPLQRKAQVPVDENTHSLVGLFSLHLHTSSLATEDTFCSDILNSPPIGVAQPPLISSSTVIIKFSSDPSLFIPSQNQDNKNKNQEFKNQNKNKSRTQENKNKIQELKEKNEPRNKKKNQETK